MESREIVRALVRAKRAENPVKSACYARTDAPPEFGGRGLKQEQRLFLLARAAMRPPNSGGED